MNITPTLDPKRFSAAAAAGFRVFPLIARWKKPVEAWGQFQDRKPTEQELQTWDASEFNVALVCGKASGIVVLDVDSPEAQMAVDELALPTTPRVKTARGYHYYFKYPLGGIRNSAAIAGLELDFRGDGGYVVGHGSIHETGHQYSWEISPADIPFAEMPKALLELLSTKRRASSPATPAAPFLPTTVDIDGYLETALSEALSEIGQAAEGSRNSTLFRAGVKLARDVAGAGHAWPPFSDLLSEAASKVGLLPAEIVATLASCWKSGEVEPTAWLKTARQWVYLSKPDAFYHTESGEYVSVNAFNRTFHGQNVGKGTFSSFLLNGGLIKVVHDLDYQPRAEGKYLERSGLTWLNTYQPSNVVAQEGDATRFTEFVSYLLPEPAEAEHLLKMIAWTVRYPGQKLRHALLLRSRAQGIGKSMLVDIWGGLLGKSNVRKTTTEEITGTYQGFIKQTLLVIVEELGYGIGPVIYNRIKDLVTGDEASVNEKFIPVRTWPNLATIVILTNLPTPMIVEQADRRFVYFDTPAQPRGREYYTAFAQWWGENLGVIRGFLDTVDLTDFDPHEQPPMTAAKQALIADGQAPLVKDLVMAIEERCGTFGRDVTTLAEIEAELGSSMRGKSKADLRRALSQVGAISFGQQRLPSMGGLTPARVSLWAIRNGRFWEVAGPQARAEEYRRSEGLLTEISAWPFEICHDSELPSSVDSLPTGTVNLE